MQSSPEEWAGSVIHTLRRAFQKGNERCSGNLGVGNMERLYRPTSGWSTGYEKGAVGKNGWEGFRQNSPESLIKCDLWTVDHQAGFNRILFYL